MHIMEDDLLALRTHEASSEAKCANHSAQSSSYLRDITFAVADEKFLTHHRLRRQRIAEIFSREWLGIAADKTSRWQILNFPLCKN